MYYPYIPTVYRIYRQFTVITDRAPIYRQFSVTSLPIQQYMYSVYNDKSPYTRQVSVYIPLSLRTYRHLYSVYTDITPYTNNYSVYTDGIPYITTVSVYTDVHRICRQFIVNRQFTVSNDRLRVTTVLRIPTFSVYRLLNLTRAKLSITS